MLRIIALKILNWWRLVSDLSLSHQAELSYPEPSKQSVSTRILNTHQAGDISMPLRSNSLLTAITGRNRQSRSYRNLLIILFGYFVLPIAVQAQSTDRPNVVLILADDLGYTDISPFGSEIRTPNIARLATQGLSFTNYHTAANCAPARAMLLTGVDSHRNGVPNIPESIPPEQMAYDHYRGS